jgi:hypothetical protein
MGSLRTLRRVSAQETKQFHQELLDLSLTNAIIRKIQTAYSNRKQNPYCPDPYDTLFEPGCILTIDYDQNGACTPQCINRVVDWCREHNYRCNVYTDYDHYKLEILWR